MHQPELKLSADGRLLSVILPAGPFEAGNLVEFKELIANTWKDTITKVVFDFSKVTFVDSATIGALLSVYRRLDRAASPVEIRSPNPAIRATFRILRLDEVFEIR